MSSPKKQKQDQSEFLLREIRNLLANEKSREVINSEQISEDEINQYLSQSYSEILNQKHTHNKFKNPTLYHSKIVEASKLIQNENAMIKSYVKAKIESEVFGSHQQTLIPSQKHPGGELKEEYRHLMNQKAELQEKIEKERVRQYQRVNELIDRTKKYRKYENVHDNLTIQKLESLIGQQALDFEQIQGSEIKINSKKNKIKAKISTERGEINLNNSSDVSFKTEQEYDGQKLAQNMKKYLSSAKNKTGKLEGRIEVVGQEETEENFMRDRNKNVEEQINSLLMRCPNFVNAFKGFLEQIIQITDFDSVDKEQNISMMIENSPNKEPKKRYVFPKKDDIPDENLRLKVEHTDISELTAQYKTKGLSLFPRAPSESTINKSNVSLLGSSGKIKKVINKRIGQTNKYHLKQCILKGNYLYYSDQQGSNIEASTLKQQRNPSTLDFLTILELQKMKKIQITLEPLEIEKSKKQEGSIFQSKVSQIEMVIVRGRERDLYFDKNFAEGEQLCEELVSLKLRRLHQLNCLLGAKENMNMENFILGDRGILDFSDEYLRPADQFPQQSYRKNFLNMLLELFPKRPNTTGLLFRNSRLGLSELNRIIAGITANFQKLHTIDFSNSKLDSKVLGEIIKLAKKCPNSETLEIKLSGCQIDDEILQSNLVTLSSVMGRIHKLDFSHNQISDKSVLELGKCLSSKVSGVRQLDLRNTNTSKFDTIAYLLKYSMQLDTIRVDGCRLRCRDLSTISSQFAKFMAENELTTKKIIISIKNNEYIQNIKEIQPILKNSLYEFELDINLPPNKQKMLISKYVCVEFDL